MGSDPNSQPSNDAIADPVVVTLADLHRPELEALVARYGARLVDVPRAREIPGSYWGDSEAGLIENDIFVRADTPAHSLLHELCHYVCMDARRRARLAVDAGGDDDEECGVCCLQILLADELDGLGRAQCLRDMDAWGYSFREGPAAAWLAGDARFARDWLLRHGLIDADDRPTYALRGPKRD
ncbi:MAG TPA: hypothetical protein VE907_17235 [Gammaproteobacteria bacterium]|nr:hypothetical protein [Gammaproteobacteria bacterium]